MRTFNWMTLATLASTENGTTLATGKSRCAWMDQPSRKIGFRIAAGRALAMYYRERVESGFKQIDWIDHAPVAQSGRAVAL